jgi:hypothetical protein
MLYIVLGVLNEVRPLWFYVLAAVLFVLSQLDYFLLSKVICKVRVFFTCKIWARTDGYFTLTGSNVAQNRRIICCYHSGDCSGWRTVSRVEKHYRG